MEIDITHNFDRGVVEMREFFEKDVPYAVSRAVIDVAYKIREHIVNHTYQQAFTVRNARFPGVLFRVDSSGAGGDALRSFKTGALMSVSAKVRQVNLPSRGGGSPTREYMRTHALGGTKRATKSVGVAIPNEKVVSRLSGGGIAKRKKPKAVRNLKTGFVVGKGNRRRVVVRKSKKADLETRYLLRNNVKINKSFRFHEDAMMVGQREIEMATWMAMAHAAKLNRNRFFRLG